MGRGKSTIAKKKVTIAVNGLCTDELSMEYCLFVYKGRTYRPGVLPLKTEKKLCLTQKDLKVYLNKYLPRYQKEIRDPTEAALTAIMNFSSSYMKTKVVSENENSRGVSKNYIFNPQLVGTIDDAQNLDNHYLMVTHENHYVAPPFSSKTAASYKMRLKI